MSAEDFGDDNALETLVTNPSTRTVVLECPGCSYVTVEEDGAQTWDVHAGSAYRLEFDVGPQEDTLSLDGIQLFPPTFTSFEHPMHVTQIGPNSKDGVELLVTGYQFRYNGAETVSEAGIELLPMTFQLTSVQGFAVHPPELTINVLKDTEGRLMIASFQATEAETAPVDQAKDCNEWPLYCKWKHILGDKVDKMRKMGKGCHKRPHGHGHPNPMEEDGTVGKPPHRFRPGKPHPHHHHGHQGHHHGHHHRFHMFLRRAFFTILIPILIGIFAGTLTYLIGMAVGCLVAIVIARFRGQSYQRIALEEEAEIEEPEERGEKEEFAELPAYDAPPIYEEADQKEVDESK